VFHVHIHEYILGEYTVTAEVLNNGERAFSEVAPDGSTSQAETSVVGVSVHSSQKSDDGGYVQEMIMNLFLG
jgi:hypothetical protein